MSRVITFSRTFPSYHPKAGQPTLFIEKVWKSLNVTQHLSKFLPYIEAYNSLLPDEDEDTLMDFDDLTPKHHTVRAGHRWKDGDWFKPVVWGNDINPKSGRSGPYHSKQIQFAPEIQVKKVWNIERDDYGIFMIEGKDMHGAELDRLAMNDGLSTDDLWKWIKWPMSGQIICWNESIEY